MTKTLVPALAAGMIATLGLPAAAQVVEGPNVEWNISTWGNPRAFTAGIEKVAELVGERTEGRFTITVHYGEALSAARENLDGIQIGAFQGAMFCNFYHPGKNPAWMVLTMPFLPLGDWDVSVRVREALMQHPALEADMERWGAMPYLSALLPQYEFLGRGEPPVELDGWEGLRVRAGGGLGDAMATLGATLTTVPATEVYTGIERGTMDAASFPYTYSHAAYQIHTITDWFTSNMQPGTTECGTVLAKRAWEALPEAYRELLMDVKDEAYEAQVQAYIDIDEVNLPMFRERLTEIVYSDEQLRAFQERAGRPVWDKWVADNQDRFDAQGLLDFTLAEIEKAQAAD
ncbi:MAG: C4-dicarboxylate ABC transporter substrate-binding protein [Pseudomonadota bacterium]